MAATWVVKGNLKGPKGDKWIDLSTMDLYELVDNSK